MQKQNLTLRKNASIIVDLYAIEIREKRLAYIVAGLQISIALINAGIAFILNGNQQYAIAILSGGMISAVNGALLAWRISRIAQRHDQEANCSHDVHYQLRMLYFYALERFMVVVALLGLSMTVLKLTPLALLGGFVMGQAVLIAAQLLLSRSKIETVTKNV